MEMAIGIGENMEELRETFESGKTRSVSWRKAQLRGILKLLQENEEQIFKALYEDLGKHRVEAYRDEVGCLTKSLNLTLSCVEKWMAPKRSWIPLIFFPATGEVLPEPLGVVLIFSSWNFPILLALEPLIGAVSAGNTVIVKPSDLSPACSSFLARVIPRYLDKNAIKVVEGGVEVGERLLQEKWDKIFFTGSPRVGRIVMSAAAKHLTPVTLELGGKCPAIVDSSLSSNDIQVAVKRLVWGKWTPCTGQACIAVDYLLVEEHFASTLIDLMKKTINKFYGENPTKSKSISRIVNKHHFGRLCGFLQDPLVAASIIHGGSIDEDNLFMEPTILLNPPIESKIMTEEIFGPILPIITLKNIQESIRFINYRPKPLAIYVFTKDETLKRRFLSQTSSGSITFNDVLIQFLCDKLPFGGVGQSGFGMYHGKYSFETFSHRKAVLRGSFLLEYKSRYPPWNNAKLEFMRSLHDYDYIGLLLNILGFKGKR